MSSESNAYSLDKRREVRVGPNQKALSNDFDRQLQPRNPQCQLLLLEPGRLLCRNDMGMLLLEVYFGCTQREGTVSGSAKHLLIPDKWKPGEPTKFLSWVGGLELCRIRPSKSGRQRGRSTVFSFCLREVDI